MTHKVTMPSETNQTGKGQTVYDPTSTRCPDKSKSTVQSRMYVPGVEESYCLMDAASLGEIERVPGMNAEGISTTM